MASEMNGYESGFATDTGRTALRRADFYVWLAVAVVVGFIGVAAVGLVGTGEFGVVSFGTAMTMIGLSIFVLAAGLIVSLVAARGAVKALEAHERALVRQVEHFAKTRAERIEAHSAEQDGAISMLADTTDRQENSIKTLWATDEKCAVNLDVLRAEERGLADRFESEVDSTRRAFEEVNVREAALAEEIKAAEAEEERQKNRLDELEAKESELERRLTRDEQREKAALEALDAERVRMQRKVREVMEEERERKEEFEALAAEEIRLMGRVRKAEQAAKAGWREAERTHEGEFLRIARPRGTHKGPFGQVYPVVDIEGIGGKYAAALGEIGIANTEDLWRANPAFVAGHLGCDPKVVEAWQEMAELMAVHGIGKQYAELLAKSGVNSIEALGDETPEHLVELVHKTEDGRGLRIQGTNVTVHNAENWIKAAKHHRPGK